MTDDQMEFLRQDLAKGRRYHAGRLVIPLLERYKVDPATGCWNWTGPITWCGYGRHPVNRKSVRAHRMFYEWHVGPIPKGLQIDHLCKNTVCVNPAHLEAVTAWENTMRSNARGAINARKTHCIHGHEFTPDNTYRDSNGWRSCRECKRMRSPAYRVRAGEQEGDQ